MNYQKKIPNTKMGLQWLITTGRSVLNYIYSSNGETELPTINYNSLKNLIARLQKYVETREEIRIMLMFKQKPDLLSLTLPLDYISTISSGERYIFGTIPTQILLDWLSNNVPDEQLEDIILID